MSHQHLESRGHIFTNRANIAYLPTRLRSSRNNDRGTTNHVVELRTCRSDAVADSYSINDALHPDTSHQLYNIMLLSLHRLLRFCERTSAGSATVLDRHENHGQSQASRELRDPKNPNQPDHPSG
jgi:hypothetical protein